MTRKIDIDVYPADVIVTRLYRRFKDWSKRGFGPDDVTWCEVKSDIEEMISAASPAPQEQGVKVKALDWDTVEERWHTASTPFNFGYEVRLTDRDVVRWRYGTRSFEPFDGSFDDAKAACQAHFEARILSALSIQEPASEPVAFESRAAIALRAMVHAVCGETGFANAVRVHSGLAYPWPALDEAEALAIEAIMEATDAQYR